jgi:hypothetical protein
VRSIKRQTKNLNFCDGCGLITSPNPNLKKKILYKIGSRSKCFVQESFKSYFKVSKFEEQEEH